MNLSRALLAPEAKQSSDKVDAEVLFGHGFNGSMQEAAVWPLSLSAEQVRGAQELCAVSDSIRSLTARRTGLSTSSLRGLRTRRRPIS